MRNLDEERHSYRGLNGPSLQVASSLYPRRSRTTPPSRCHKTITYLLWLGHIFLSHFHKLIGQSISYVHMWLWLMLCSVATGPKVFDSSNMVKLVLTVGWWDPSGMRWQVESKHSNVTMSDVMDRGSWKEDGGFRLNMRAHMHDSGVGLDWQYQNPINARNSWWFGEYTRTIYSIDNALLH